jgi:hypothetical protein
LTDKESETTEDKNKKSGEASKAVNPNKKVLIIIASVIGGLIILSIIGSIIFGMLFKKAAEKTFEKATGSELDIGKDGKTVKVKSEDGESTFSTENKKLSDDFPKFIKIYPKAKLVSSSSFASNGDQFFTATFQSKDSPDKVLDFYKTELSEKNGYKVLSSSQTDDIAMIQTQNEAEGRTVGITVMPDKENGGSTIQVSSGKLQK